jgi:hypothetical protein
VTRAIAFARLKPWEQRQRKQQDIVTEINKGLAQIPGIRLFATNPPSLGQGGANSKPVEFVLRSSEPYTQIKGYVDQLLAEASRLAGADQSRIEPDPRQAADQGLDRPSARRRSRGRRRCHRPHHGDAAGRPAGHALQHEWRAVRRRAAGRRARIATRRQACSRSI